MIKKWRAGAWVAASLSLAACQQSAEPPPGYQGLVEFDERVLAFEMGGRIESLSATRGQPLAVNEVIASLDDGLERTARSARAEDADAMHAQVALLQAGARSQDLRALSAQIRAARASEALLEKNLERERALKEQGVSTGAAVDELDARWRSAVAEREALEHRRSALASGARPEELDSARARAGSADQAVKLADERLERYSLRARHPGTVLDVHAEAGEVVAPGAPIVTVADIAHPYADVFVPEGRLDGVKVGAKASLRVDATPQPFSGHVEDVSRRAEFTPRFVFSERERPNLVLRVRVRIDDPEHRLHAGVPAFVQIAPATGAQPALAGSQ